jgi:hypothetical protein
MIKRLILPSKPSDQTTRETLQGLRNFPFSIPKPPTPFYKAGFERGSVYQCLVSFTHNNSKFEEGEILEVIGNRKYGPMAALEIIFRNSESGEKKFWVLHHNRHDYSQDKFLKL